MFQEFYSDTMVSRFIKYLLSNTSLPLYHAISDDNEIIKGCRYIYKDFIIKCVKSGKFISEDTNQSLAPSDAIYPSAILAPAIGYEVGKYQIIGYYNPNDPKLHYKFNSKTMYYDPETHLYLGEYLRNLRDKTGLNLLPYYNCFNHGIIDNLELHHPNPNDTGKTYSILSNPRSDIKLYAIPIRFGQTYTVAIDSATPVLMRSIVYHKDFGNVKKTIEVNPKYYSDDINDYESFSQLTFTKPILRYAPSADSAGLYAQEKNLYLVIQVSAKNDSSLVVLEGDYTRSWDNIVSNFEEFKPSITKPALLHFNCKKSFAFSNRLLEYLIGNIITPLDPIPDNMTYLTKIFADNEVLSKYDYPQAIANNKLFTAIWDDRLRDTLVAYIQERSLDPKLSILRDQDGYLNSDLERLITIETAHTSSKEGNS